jgi:GR25 family glycosyltransferase involved in LPS biosynthesis
MPNYTRKHKKFIKPRKTKLRGGQHPQQEYPPSDINNIINNIIYINLDKRKNRNERINTQLSIFNKEKIHRLSAVDNAANRVVGCATSHLNALKLARDNKYPNVLILEDDAIWANINESYPVFKMLVEKPYDVIMLGGTYKNYNKNTYRVNAAQAASSYLVNSSYYDKIISRIERDLNDPKADKNVDVMYVGLQGEDKWFIVMPALMIQGKSMSNLQGYNTNYTNLFK